MVGNIFYVINIYYMSGSYHNDPNQPGIQDQNGHTKTTLSLPKKTAGINGTSIKYTQANQLTFQTAPRPVSDISFNGGIINPSYHFPPNNSIGNNTTYSGEEIDPLNNSGLTYTAHGDTYYGPNNINPHFLFMGKFASQSIQNTDPVKVGHLDISGETVDQQPSNIYNIPDNPKDYTVYLSQMQSGAVNNNGTIPKSNFSDFFNSYSGINQNRKIVYDASSCPVNWRVFGPIQKKVIDLSENGVGGGGSGGTGTDLSFNNFFFKQPEMPIDCSCVFVAGTGSANDKLNITWKKPFNRKAGSRYNNNGVRYFYENNLQTTSIQENWLPHFSELVLDISGGPNSRQFCKDISNNFVHNDGVGNSAFALLSANNTEINVEASNNGNLNFITSQYVNGSFNYGTSGKTTTIRDNFTPNSINNAGGSPNQSTSDIGLGSTYDIALYYRNETKINTPPSLSNTDLKYNNHNICLFQNVIFGIPGLSGQPNNIVFWNDSATDRIYLGGIGPTFKDEKGNPPGEGLNLPWNNTNLIKVGYDCSLNITYNVNRVQAGQATVPGSLTSFFGINNQFLSLNNFDVNFNLNANAEPDTMPNTKQNWPNGTGTGGTGANTGAASSNNDYIQLADIASGVPSSSARDHPEYAYEITEYNVTNDTIDKTTGDLLPVTHPTISSSNPFKFIVPINTRAYCNETTFTEYNNMMTSVTETPTTNSKTFLKFYNRGTGGDTLFTAPSSYNNPNNYYNARAAGTSNDNFSDVVFVDTFQNVLVLKSDTIFKQLANYGDPKSSPISQSQNDLVESDAYLGVLSSSTTNYLSRIELTAGHGTGSVAFTPVPDFTNSSGGDPNPNRCDIFGYTNVSPPSLSTITQTKLKTNQGHDYTYIVGPPFDIAKNDTETIYSNKRGYYLGFDVSGVEIELDPASGNQSGPPFSDSSQRNYDQYKITLKHKAEKRSGGFEEEKKELIFRLGIKPPNDIGIDLATNVPVVSGNKYSNTNLSTYFGVKRLPRSSQSDGQSGGIGLELQYQFTLTDIDLNWIPYFTGNVNEDNIAEVHFVVDPANSANGTYNNLLTLKQDKYKWSNASPSPGPSSGSPNLPPKGQETFSAFVEIDEGSLGILTVPYSRSVTEAIPQPRNLLGLYDNKLYYSHNVTFKENVKFPTGALNYNNAQKHSIPASGSLGAQDKFKFNNLELFWDYTWPNIPVSGNGHAVLPASFGTNTTIEYMMELPDFDIGYHTHLANSGDGVWGTPGPAFLGSGDEHNLPRLSATQTANPASGSTEYSKQYNHDETLNVNLPTGSTTPSPYYRDQCMWANRHFVGANSSTSGAVTSADNPYIDYNSTYAYQSENYSSLQTSGYNYQRNITNSNFASNMSIPLNSSGSTAVTFNNLKWILLKVKETFAQPVKAVGNSFQVELKGDLNQSAGTPTPTLKLGIDYLLFYCEYKPNAYTVDGIQNCDYSTWLDVCSKNIPGGGGAVTSMGNVAGNGGNGNGGHEGSGGETTPNVVDLQQSTNKKYLLIGVGEDVKISSINLTKTP